MFAVAIKVTKNVIKNIVDNHNNVLELIDHF